MKHAKSKFFLIVVIVMMAVGIAGILSAQSDSGTVELVFVNHLAIGAAEQDVLWMDEDGALWRVSPDDPLSLLAQPMYASTSGAEHDPFAVGENPLGPYEQGEMLEFTLGEWLAAEGHGSYAMNGDSAQLDATLTNLVPNGVYTMWCSQIFVPPNFEIKNYPCGSADGSESVFTADENGDATFSVSINPLEPTTAESISLFAVNYHSDGNTYGADPGNFGHSAHVQIFAMLPAEDA